jgi:hypothetical protein
VKALTVKLPWAYMISTGAKLVENRSMHVAYRGPLAVHAGADWSKRGAADERCRLAWWGDRWYRHQVLEATDFSAAFRRILAVADLVDVHPDQQCCRPWGESTYLEAGGRTRTVVYHWVLGDIRRLPEPVPCTGRLGLWTLPNEVAEQVTRQLAEVTR